MTWKRDCTCDLVFVEPQPEPAAEVCLRRHVAVAVSEEPAWHWLEPGLGRDPAGDACEDADRGACEEPVFSPCPRRHPRNNLLGLDQSDEFLAVDRLARRH